MAAAARSSPTAPAADPGILRMAGPLVVSFWMRSAFAVVDTIYAATIGDHAVAAIGLTVPFEFAMIAVWVGLSTGLTSHLARAMGARDGGRVEQLLRASWRLVLATVPVFTLLGLGCAVFARSIAPEAQLVRPFAIYSSVLLVGSAFSMFWSVIPDSIVKAHHDTRATMWAGILSNVINVVLNTIFTFVFHWGIFGIAFSTVLGRYGGLWYALRKAAAHEARRKERDAGMSTTPEPRPYRAILSLAVPSAGAYLLMACEAGILNAVLGMLPQATQAIAAFAIYGQILRLAITPAIAAAVAMLPYAARRIGAGDMAGLRRGLREAHVAGLVYAALLVPLVAFGAGPLARSMSTSEVTARFATFALWLLPLACLTSLPFFLVRPVFEGMGQGRPGLVVALLRYVVLTAPAAWLGIEAAAAMGEPGFHGVVVGLLVASAIASLVFLVWIRSAIAERTLSTTSLALD